MAQWRNDHALPIRQGFSREQVPPARGQEPQGLHSQDQAQGQAMREIANLLMAMLWLCGIVLAKGFWSTFFAVICPLWAWYLVAEKLVERWL